MSWTKKVFLIVKEQKYCIQKIHSLGFDMNLGSFESDEMFPPVRESRHRGLQWGLQEVLALQGGGGGKQGAWGENLKENYLNLPLHILTLQSLLYRCPPGYLFSTVIVRCAKQEEVSCPLDPPPEADFRWTSFLAPTKLGCFCNMFVNILLQGRDHHPAECQPAWRLLCSLGLKIMLGSKICYKVFVLPCLPFMFCHNLFSAIILPHLLFCQIMRCSATFVTTQWLTDSPTIITQTCQSAIPLGTNVANLNQQWLHLS